MQAKQNVMPTQMTVAQARMGVIRLPFLLLTLSCMGLGVVLAWLSVSHSQVWDAGRAVWVVLAALSAHVSVNAWNEWHDFRSGLDLQTQRTPFSGGSGALPAYPQLVSFAWWVAAGSLALTAGIGLYLVATAGAARLPLLLLGGAGAALVLAYTPWITRWPVLCALAPGLAFGPIFVWGTCLALVQHVPASAWWAACLPFGLTNNLLLLNQVPDIAADRRVGRLTLPMQRGLLVTVRVMCWQWWISFGAIAMGVVFDALPLSALWVLAWAPLAIWHGWQLHRWCKQVATAATVAQGVVPPGMALNVILAVGVPAFLALVLMA